MSKSLALVNGDLAIFGRSYATVEGSAKLVQDLRLWVLERIGTDPATPTYGSTLDGGVVNGVSVPSFIGEQLDDNNSLAIQGVVQTLLQTYQQNQLAKMKAEVTQYGKTTMSNDEIIHTIDSIQVAIFGTTVIIQAHLTTLAGETFTLTIPLAV
jgi:hypothetical protein